MISSFVMFLGFVFLFGVAIYYAARSAACAHSKEGNHISSVVMFGLTSIICSIMSSAILIGGYLVYVAEHTLK